MNFGTLYILINVFDDSYIMDSNSNIPWEQNFLLWELICCDVK